MTVSYNCEGSGAIHLDVLKAICGGTSGKSMIDLCCGFAPQTRQLGFSNRFYVDSVERDLAEETENFLVRDIFDFTDFMFLVMVDTTFMLDAIEHFPKNKSHKLVEWMETNSRKQIIFTPLGDYIIETEKTDNPDSHKSGWLPQEFEDIGWATIVFPNFHPTLNIGAFFAWHCENVEQDFERVVNELNQKEWTK